jgi:2-succinyl-6-hydroxy-2,4-cyclohexadiene-1-carboxylate synthase
MLINLTKVKLNVKFSPPILSDKTPIIFLHGFTGSSKDWEEITPDIDKDFYPIAIDLIGHGESESSKDIKDYSCASQIEQLLEVIKKITDDKIILAGYSMGGRLALSFAAKHQEMLKGLILESSSPGIKEDNLREERLKHDNKLAEFIENHSINEFVDYWMTLDLFKTQKRLSVEKLKSVREYKLKNDKIGLANSLRGFGIGEMPPLFDDLKNIKINSLLITGELDEKFCKVNSSMSLAIPNVKHHIIKNAGHNVHLEYPGEFVNVINYFLKEL